MRGWQRMLAAVVIVCASGLTAAPAWAGGGTWLFEGHHRDADPVLVSGERVRATALLSLEGVGPRYREGAYWGGPQHGPFYGYISPRNPRGPGFYAPPVPADAVLVDEVHFEETKKRGVLEAVLEFTVPQLEPGLYALHHCNDPCTRQIGDTWTTRITIVGNEDDALLARAIDDIEQRLDTTQPALRIRVRNLTDKLERLTLAVESMREERDREPATASTQKQPTPTAQEMPWAPVLIAVAVLALVLLGRRSRSLSRNVY